MTRGRALLVGAGIICLLGVMIVLSQVSGGHAGHDTPSIAAGTPTGSSDAATEAKSSSPALRVGLMVVLVGGWAAAFVTGIWRRSRATSRERAGHNPMP